MASDRGDGALLLPEGSCLVHIGPQKTGTTMIQVSLVGAGPELAEHGVSYVTGSDHRHRRAGWALGLRGRPQGVEPPPIKVWERFAAKVEEARRTCARVVVSNEDFARAQPEQIRRLVADLGGERAHVLAVVRRLDLYLPSQWQQRVQGGDERDYEEWLRFVLDGPEDDDKRQGIWFTQDTAALVSRWLDVVPPERFTLLVADDGDREQLPRTFEGMLGLPTGTLRPPGQSNRSLGWAETELVREVNLRVRGEGWTRQQRRELVTQGLIQGLQSAPRRHEDGGPPLPRWAFERLRELSVRRVEEVRALAERGIRVVGDLDRMLAPDDVPVVDGPLEPPGPGYDLAASAVAAVLARAAALGGR